MIRRRWTMRAMVMMTCATCARAADAPQAIAPLLGTVILATAGRGDESAPPLFHLGHSSAVVGLTV